MHGRPAVGAVVDVAGDACVASDADDGGHEAVVALTVDGRRKPQDRRSHAAIGQRERELRGLPTRPHASLMGSVEVVPVMLGREPPGRGEEGSGGEDERAVRAGERLAERLDCTAICVSSLLETAAERQLVVEGEVDHALGRGGLFSKRFEVVEAAAAHLDARGGERGCGGVRAGEPDDSCPAPSSSGTTADPIQPDAPVTKTRIVTPFNADVSY